MFPKLKFTKEQIEDYYSKVTPDMVRTSLAADRPTYFDLLNLLSPAAAQPEFREALRETAMKARRRYYGKNGLHFRPALHLEHLRELLPLLRFQHHPSCGAQDSDAR